ncbi:MAG TPA: hypothetical protein VM184_09075 [Gaiellaceae bacterium]|nr:hypothetical protein [Gaiellaceae bacterium]
MFKKLIPLVAGLAIAAGLASSAAAAPKACPEQRGACQPIGDRLDAQKPKRGSQVNRPKFVPKADSSGQLWRAGNHIMY